MTALRATPNSPFVVVDDSFVDRRIAQKCYSESKLTFPFLALESGEELIQYLGCVQKGTAELPCIVLLDINMPSLNGFETLAHIRSLGDYESLPIIMMLTQSDVEEDVEKARSLGANAFQTKPWGFQEYIDFFDSLCDRTDFALPCPGA